MGLNVKPLKLSVVSAIYNEEDCIEEFLARTIKSLNFLNIDSEIILIDDGSSDKTAQRVINFRNSTRLIKGNNFGIEIKIGRISQNVGHQMALLCGMSHARGRAVVTIDADLQDPPENILDLYQEFSSGHEIVVMRRKGRSPSDTWFKKFSAKCFYRIIGRISDVPIEPEAGDFRLLSSRCNALAVQLSMGSEYIRGTIQVLGPKPIYLDYSRDGRYAGKTKYSLGKMVNLSLNAVVKTSLKPLRLSIYLGVFALLLSTGYSVFVLTQRLLNPESLVKGYTTLLVVILWGFSITFTLIATIAQYVVRIIEEKRPPQGALVEKWL